jgi:hypothetical protein
MKDEERIEQLDNEGVKYDNDKLRVDLIPIDSLLEVAKVYTFGARKYKDNNWRLGIAWSRVFGALIRHSFAWFLGEDKDSETGLSHMAHAAWCCLTLLNYVITKPEWDDRIQSKVDMQLPNQAIEFLSKFKKGNLK